MRTTRLTALMALLLALVVLPAAAQAKDRDHDGLPDKWEKRNHLSTKAKSANRDNDRDGVDNHNEYREGTKAKDRDSDNDGKSDGREDRDRDGLVNRAEDASGNDPRDRDTDSDGIVDGKEQAGVVTAYENGELTIDLANGGSVTATVTDDTEVECQTEATAEDDQSDARAQTSQRGPGGDPPRREAGSQDGPSGDPGAEHHCGGAHGDADQSECPAGTLAVGAKIHEAQLKVTSDGKEWVEIEVLTSA
jgi:hypothetical protein